MIVDISDYDGVVDIEALGRFIYDCFPPKTIQILKVKDASGKTVRLIDLEAFILPSYKLPAPAIRMISGQSLTFETKK
jgi:hypothetical protein